MSVSPPKETAGASGFAAAARATRSSTLAAGSGAAVAFHCSSERSSAAGTMARADRRRPGPAAAAVSSSVRCSASRCTVAVSNRSALKFSRTLRRASPSVKTTVRSNVGGRAGRSTPPDATSDASAAPVCRACVART
ncbi:hypothetical protein GCM10010532_041600 [Dactylosporangium siamense]